MRVTKIAFCVIAASLIALSCEDDSQTYADASELSDFARNYLQMMGSPGINSMASLSSKASPINDSYSRLTAGGRGTGGGRAKGDSTSSDTTFIPSPWVSCAKITEINNGDGSITVIYDYGDGCEEGNEYWKYFVRGKYTYTYKSEMSEEGPLRKDSYSYSYKTENYGGRYYFEDDTIEWASNGSSTSKGYSLFNSLTNQYSGSSTSNTDDTYIHNGLQSSYKGHTTSSYNEKQFVIEESENLSDFGDDYYHSAVLDPLVAKYDCSANAYRNSAELCMYLPMYVSGREFVKYRQNGVEGSFLIDWGNGACDSKFTILENNKLVVVDLANPEEIFAKK